MHRKAKPDFSPTMIPMIFLSYIIRSVIRKKEPFFCTIHDFNKNYEFVYVSLILEERRFDKFNLHNKNSFTNPNLNIGNHLLGEV